MTDDEKLINLTHLGVVKSYIDKVTDDISPTIGENGNWFIGTTDTGVKAEGTDGKSIKSITRDANNNIIVTFTDGTTQNIGKLTIDVQADFLTSEGFGNLRYYNGQLQYYDTNTSAWVDTSITPDNVYIINMMPQPMVSINGNYDTKLEKFKLKWEEPDDTIIDGQIACVVEKVIIRRKLGSAPLNENDGDLVIEVPRHSFGTYRNIWYVDESVSPNIGEIYYYKAFPMSTTGFYNNSYLNETNIVCEDYVLYGFKLDQNESDPASMITYLSDCDNAVYKSAYMNYSTDTFNYGDWKEAWFINDLKPCMLKYDGTVDYELDKNDYTKKIDGTDSDVANPEYEGNAMIGFPKVYWKIIDNGDNTANIYFCNKKIDDDFVCWSHIDNNGNEIDYCYMPIYTGYVTNNKMRSISDTTSTVNNTVSDEIIYATANNTDDNVIWYTETFSDRQLVNLLLLLISKSTDTQSIFGMGNCNATSQIQNGTMNTKGLFWGNSNQNYGVKVFGMENWWGNLRRRIAGWVTDSNGNQLIKMTYSTLDSSDVVGYNTDGNGYINIEHKLDSNGYIKSMSFDKFGLIPSSIGGSSSTYYPDYCANDVSCYAFVGDNNNGILNCGSFYVNISHSISVTGNSLTASLSCKPLALTT